MMSFCLIIYGSGLEGWAFYPDLVCLKRGADVDASRQISGILDGSGFIKPLVLLRDAGTAEAQKRWQITNLTGSMGRTEKQISPTILSGVLCFVL